MTGIRRELAAVVLAPIVGLISLGAVHSAFAGLGPLESLAFSISTVRFGLFFAYFAMLTIGYPLYCFFKRYSWFPFFLMSLVAGFIIGVFVPAAWTMISSDAAGIDGIMSFIGFYTMFGGVGGMLIGFWFWALIRFPTSAR